MAALPDLRNEDEGISPDRGASSLFFLCVAPLLFNLFPELFISFSLYRFPFSEFSVVFGASGLEAGQVA